jgi:hypothetical protein
MANIKDKLDKLVKAISYDTAPNPPCNKFCSDLEDCQNNRTVCLYRRGHHIFHWSDIIARRNECSCPSAIYEDNPKKYKVH